MAIDPKVEEDIYAQRGSESAYDPVTQRRHPGRRYDDPKGVMYHAALRKLILTSASIVTLSGPFFIWWLNGQYKEKERAIEDIRTQYVELVKVKQELLQIREQVITNRESANTNLLRIEEKVDMLIYNLDGMSKRIRGRPQVQVMRVPVNEVVVCRGGWEANVKIQELDDYLRKYKEAQIGQCR